MAERVARRAAPPRSRPWSADEPFPAGDDRDFEAEITAVGSYDGDILFAGTKGGRLFRFDRVKRTLTELGVPGRNWPNGDRDAAIDHIAVDANAAFVSFNKAGRGSLLRVLPKTAQHADAVALPTNDVIYGIEFAPTPTGTLIVVATDRDVFQSDYPGQNWVDGSTGLPRTPHCADLRSVVMPNGEAWLYLATFGRSVWRAALAGPR